MVMSMKEFGRTIVEMDLEKKFIKKVKFMKVNGKMTWNMENVLFNIKMEINFKDYIKIIKNLMENKFIKIKMNMKEDI